MSKSELQRACDRLGIEMTATYGKAKLPYAQRDEWRRKAHNYRCVLRYDGRQMSTDFWSGPANEYEPETADVIGSLLIDSRIGEMSYRDYLSDFGLDDSDFGLEDDKDHRATWRTCKSTAERLRKFLGDKFDYLASKEY